MSNEKSGEISTLGVSSEFIEENKRANLVKPRQKFAPYTKEERIERRKEVYRLHFEHGMPATRIADLMNVDRNTINNDLSILYKQLKTDNLNIEFADYYVKQMVRLEVQRARLVTYLETTKEIEQKISVERLLADIDTKMLTISEKVSNSKIEVLRHVYESLNEKLEELKLNDRYITLEDVLRVSPSGWKQIFAILKKEGLTK